MKDPRIINQPNGEDDFWVFELPTYKVTESGLVDDEPILLKFCRGNKLDENAPRQVGVLTESVLMAVKTYLEKVNVGPLQCRETSIMVTKLDEAIMWAGKRAEDRKRREVQGTYQK